MATNTGCYFEPYNTASLKISLGLLGEAFGSELSRNIYCRLVNICNAFIRQNDAEFARRRLWIKQSLYDLQSLLG